MVAGASLDDTSNSALMAAWTSLYNAGQPGDGRRPDKSPPAAAPAQPIAQTLSAATEPELDPYLDDDFGMPVDDMPSRPRRQPHRPPRRRRVTPAFGGGGFPGGATTPGLGSPGGFALPGPLPASDASPKELDDAPKESDEPEDLFPR